MLSSVELAGLSQEHAAHVARYFHDRVFPVLTPLAIDSGHPMLLVSEPSLNLAVVVRHRLTGCEHLAWLRIPSLLPRLVALPDGRFLPLEQVVAIGLRALFPGMEIVDHAAFHLTCESVDAPRRRARAMRLEITPDVHASIRDQLVRHLRLAATEVEVVDRQVGGPAQEDKK